jgi:ADP-heptose:LPS heptosyltransferase
MDEILIIHQGALGDLIVSLRSFYAIRTAFTGSTVEVMGYPRILSLIQGRFYADRISSVDRAEIASLYSKQALTSTPLKSAFSTFKHIFVFGTIAQHVLVENLGRLTDAEVFHVTTFPEKTGEHVIDYQLSMLARYGLTRQNTIPQLFLTETDVHEAERLLHEWGVLEERTALIAIHPGSGSRQKNWPVSYYISLVKELYVAAKGSYLLIDGPADRELADVMILELDHVPVVRLQSLELPLLAAVLKHAGLFIGNDSGITHLAAAVGIPAVAIFGPTDPGIWGPRGDSVRIMRAHAAESGSWEWIHPAAVRDAAVGLVNSGC